MELSEEKFIEILDARFKANEQRSTEILDARFKANEQRTTAILDARFKASEAVVDGKFKSFETVIDAKFKANRVEMKEIIEQTVNDKAQLIIDQTRSEILASENRQDKKLEAMEQRIIEGVGDLVDNSILPQIEEHDKRITKLEVKLAV